MEISAALAADLGLLTDALNDPDIDIIAVLRLMARDLKSAVDSFAGLSLSVLSGDQLMSFTAMERGSGLATVVSSMRLPLAVLPGADGTGDGSLILYAGRAGAFVDLAADLSWLTGHELGRFTLDQHLHLPPNDGAGRGLREASAINQAIGVLIGRGFTPEEAARELAARAAAAGSTRYAIAETLLAAPHEDRSGTESAGP